MPCTSPMKRLCATLAPDLHSKSAVQVEEWGEAYQEQSWGPLIELVTADLKSNARRDKARRHLR